MKHKNVEGDQLELEDKLMDDQIISALSEGSDWKGVPQEMWEEVEQKLQLCRKIWKRKIKLHTIMTIIFIILLGMFIFITRDGGKINSYFQTKTYKMKKPVIYLYPEKEMKIDVKLLYKGNLTCTYPSYNNGWKVIAKPDGTILNLKDNKEYSYLYWEGKSNSIKWDLSRGYIIEGKDTRYFLQKKLAEIGLTPKEYNEFIVFWLPQMENNKYNFITFAGKEYDNGAPLIVNPRPDSVLRVFMIFKPLEEPINIEEPNVRKFKRKGFTVVEWGGTELN